MHGIPHPTHMIDSPGVKGYGIGFPKCRSQLPTKPGVFRQVLLRVLRLGTDSMARAIKTDKEIQMALAASDARIERIADFVNDFGNPP